jgi:cell volume regulation protein A
MEDGQLILAAGALLTAGLLASLLAVRVRVPSLVLFLGVGMVIGSLWIDFDDYELASTLGIIALALILYEGGLNAGFSEIRPVLGAAVSLALVGTLVTAILTGPWRQPTAPRSSRSCAGRRSSGGWHARSRASPA